VNRVDKKVLEAIRGGAETHVQIDAATGLQWAITGAALTRLHRAGRIERTGRTSSTRWRLATPRAEQVIDAGWAMCQGYGFAEQGAGAGV
jgi:hypothetical protein